MQADVPPRPRCHATNRRGDPCGAYAIPGGTVCTYHGGAAPQVQRKASLRLLELVDPAIAVLAREMDNPEASAGERIRAAENVLDRAGYPRRVTTDVETAREMLIQRLNELRERRAADRSDDAANATVVGEVIQLEA